MWVSLIILFLGWNFRYYGGTVSEKVLGKGLKASGVPRSEYIVSTKCGRYIDGFDFSAERIMKSIDESLERLQLDYVDILQCHDIEFVSLDQVLHLLFSTSKCFSLKFGYFLIKQWHFLWFLKQIVNETIPALQKIKEAGKTRFIGITGLPLGIFPYVLDRVPPGTIDVILSYCHYSINDTTLEDMLPYFKSKGAAVISASPVAMGLLTNNDPPEWHPASPELKVFPFFLTELAFPFMLNSLVCLWDAWFDVETHVDFCAAVYLLSYILY